MPFDWKGTVATVAPTIATALGGPLVGLATKALISVFGLGDGASDDEIAKAIQGATPEQLLALKKEEQAFVVRMRELDIEVDKLQADDRKSARDRAVAMRDWTPQIIGFCVLCVWAYVNVFMLNTNVKPAIAPEIVGRILGMVDGAALMFLAWLYGTTRTAGLKDETIRKLS